MTHMQLGIWVIFVSNEKYFFNFHTINKQTLRVDFL